MIIEVTIKADVKTPEKTFTPEIKAEITLAISLALRPFYPKQGFISNFNKSNGARIIDHYEIDCKLKTA